MSLTEVFNQILSYLIPALATFIAGWFAVLGNKIKDKYKQVADTKTKQIVVEETVNYVQQLYKELDGNEKLKKAIEQAEIILKEKEIPVSEVELRVLIESAVYGLKKGLLEEEYVLPKVLTSCDSVECEKKEGK